MIESTDRTLAAWQRGVELAIAIYEVTKRFPVHERFGLSQQLRRAAVSVPSNIAEGRGRGTPGDYRHFLFQARGSLFELETELHIAECLHYCDAAAALDLRKLITATIRPLAGLIKSLRD